MAYYYTQATYDPATRAIVRNSLLQIAPASLSAAAFSVCQDTTTYGQYVTAFLLEGGMGELGTVLLAKRNPLVPGTPVLIATYSPGETIKSLAVCAQRSVNASSLASYFWLSFAIDDGRDVLGGTWCTGFGPGFAQTFSAAKLDTEVWQAIDNVAVFSETPRVYTSGIVPAGEGGEGVRLVYRPCQASNGALVQPLYLVGRGLAVARGFEWRGKAYLPVALTDPDGFVSGTVRHLSETDGVGGWVAPLVGSFSVGEQGSFDAHAEIVLAPPVRLPPAISPEDKWVFVALARNGISQTRLDRVTLTAPYEHVRLASTVAQGLAVLPGSLTTFFDGQRTFEAGFLERPSVELYLVAYEGAIEPGSYLYIALWEHFDARGNVHHSKASNVASVTLEADSVVTLEVTTNRTTRRAWKDDTRDNGARLVVYRTKKNSTGPFYRLVTPTATDQTPGTTGERPLENDPTFDEIRFDDDTPDETMDALGYGFYPYNLSGAIPGGVLESDPVPPTLGVVNAKGRLFAISGDDSRQIIYSRFFVAGEGPAFPAAFRIFLSDTEEGAVALASLDDKLLIFTASRIYYVYGEGPSDNAMGGAFSEPILFSTAVGCAEPRSVVTTPIGVMFLAGNGGIYLVSPKLEVARISGPAEDAVAVAAIRSVHLDAARGWVVWSQAVGFGECQMLVFSYWTGQWVTWGRGEAGVSTSCLWQGKHVFGAQLGQDFGRVAVERTYNHDDRAANAFGDAVYASINPVVETPWLRLGALNGFQRVRRVQIGGFHFRSIGSTPDEIEVSLAHDGDETVTQTATFAVDDVNNPNGLKVGLHVARQKCASIKVRVVLREPDGGDGTTLHAIALELGGKRGFAKLSKANKAGNGGA